MIYNIIYKIINRICETMLAILLYTSAYLSGYNLGRKLGITICMKLFWFVFVINVEINGFLLFLKNLFSWFKKNLFCTWN